MVWRSTTSALVLDWVPEAKLREAYERIENDLQYIREKSYADWIPADIYALLKSREADLYVAFEQDKYVGFLVVSLTKNKSGGSTLYIWATYQDPKCSHSKDGFLFLDQLAQKLDVSAIEFQSSRSGWGRVVKKYGFEEIGTIYRKGCNGE